MTPFAGAIACSAFLLFLVQPIIAKQILPWFGGSAAVWTTCLVFFQTVLLAGYAYSDALIRRATPRVQFLVHGALVLASLAALPITADAGWKPVNADAPALRILLLLAATIGLPFFVLATTGPLVQAWFARRFAGAQVYRLYALSNLASMAALLAYPPLIEPLASMRTQALGWSVGYGVFAVLVLATAWLARVKAPAGVRAPCAPGTAGQEKADSVAAAARDAAPSLASEQTVWFLLAACGSVLLLTVSAHITQNIASVPFLWILPLAVYLLSFILCFDGSGWYRRGLFLPLSALMLMALTGGLSFRFGGTWFVETGPMPVIQAVPLYVAGLFVLCMTVHGELVEHKPTPLHLTRFYLMVSLGGAAGGFLVGIVAPLVLSWQAELPAVLVALAFALGGIASGWRRALALVAFAGCVATATLHWQANHESAVDMKRNFYGTLAVKAIGENADARWRLAHGNTTHGEQFRAGERAMEPTTYYGEESGIGRAIFTLRALDAEAPQRVGIVGLGAGTIATYGRADDTYRIYEINPQVLELARTRFSFLARSQASVQTVLGDARLALEREAAQRFDVLAIDAFSSDSIPVHLMTREALALYAHHVRPGGVIAFHVSNRYLDLAPVLFQLAEEIGWDALRIEHRPAASSHLYPSTWVLLSAERAVRASLRGDGPDFAPPPRRLPQPWTDDYNNLFEVLKK